MVLTVPGCGDFSHGQATPSVTATEVFEACGTWRASIDDPARIAGTVNGTFGYLRLTPTAIPVTTGSQICIVTQVIISSR